MDWEGTAEQVVLKCVNSLELLPDQPAQKISQLGDGRFYARLISILKNQDVPNEGLVNNIPILESILKEHFTRQDLVNFDDVAAGDAFELTKLSLLTMYIVMFADSKLRAKMVNSHIMDQATQMKVKYLIESIQRKGTGLSKKFLDILCTEKLHGKVMGRCQTPVSSSAWGSPVVYSSSPKAPPSSPLRDLVQSPSFGLQKVLHAKMKEVKKLTTQIHNLENEKQEAEVGSILLEKRVTKLTNDLEKCQAELKDQKSYRDELETKLMAGKDLKQQQMQRLTGEISLLRTENSSLQETVNKLLDSHDELSTKNDSLQGRNQILTAERDRVEEELSTLSEARIEHESIIESQSYHLKELKTRIEELHQCLMEDRPNNRTIELTFDSPSGSPFRGVQSPCSDVPNGSGGNTSGENMADAVVDKILRETQYQLARLQAEHAKLQQNLANTTHARDELLTQVEGLSQEKEGFSAEMANIKRNLEQLTTEHTTLQEQLKATSQRLQESQNTCASVDSARLTLTLQMEELRTNLSQMTAEWETVSHDKKLLNEELQSSMTAQQAVKAQLEATLQATQNKVSQLEATLQATQAKESSLTLQLEAKEKEVTQQLATFSSQEEIMRVEREGEKAICSLSEELQAARDKGRTDRQSTFEKMKQSYKTETEKLLIKIQELEKVEQENSVIHNKYEHVKVKLVKYHTELNEAKAHKSQYEKQVNKYKDHVTQLNETLQAEKAKREEDAKRIMELEFLNQPLKEKLKESELSLKRLGDEKRNTEVQLQLADTKVREMQRNWDRESFGVPTRSLGGWSKSDSRLTGVPVARPSSSSSSSSAPEDISTNDSTAQLLPLKSTRNKKSNEAVSSGDVFKQPTHQASKQELQQKSIAVAAANKKKAAASSKQIVTSSSLGRSVPRTMQFNCEDEEEQFNHKFLIDMQAGNAVDDRKLLNLTEAAENLGLDSPAFNLRKRKSLSMSTNSQSSLDSSGGKRSKRLSISYSRPGPPTPGKKGQSRADKENNGDHNISPLSARSASSQDSKISTESAYSVASPVSTRQRKRRSRVGPSPGAYSTSSSCATITTPGAHSTHSGRSPTVLSKKGVATPRGKRGKTPSSIRKRGKSGADQEVARKFPRPEQLLKETISLFFSVCDMYGDFET